MSVMNPLVDPSADDDRIGICCSGGGIRSASFNLGALQAVQQRQLLQEVRYLAAVSGGSYIAAAFAMVAKTRDGGPNDPPGDESDPDLVTPDAPPFHPGSPEEQYLRNRASYLAPTGGDRAFLAWRVLLGLLINVVLVGAVVTVVAAVLALYYRSADPGLIRPIPAGVAIGASPNGNVWGGGLAASVLGVVLGAFSIMVRPRRRDAIRRFLEVWSLIVFVVGLVIFALELILPVLIDALRKNHQPDTVQASRTLGVSMSATVAGIAATIVAQLRAQTADPAKAIRDAKGKLAALAPRARLAFIYVAAELRGPLLIAGMLVASTMVQVETTYSGLRWGVPATALVVLLLFARLGDLNSWSLHPFYRRRLCTAFALRRIKSEGDQSAGHAEQRREGELVPLSRTSVVPRVPPWSNSSWPTLIVCAAANISDPGASPPGRGVTSFTFSPDEMGGPLVGGVATEVFERALCPSRQRDFTLPAVVAMSGAAIAPSMGKLSRPSIRFLMAMANVRLGVWVPNPRRMDAFLRIRVALRKDADGIADKAAAIVGRTSHFSDDERAAALITADSKQRFMPRPTPRYLLKELLGWNSINDKFLYVTDGGHYENLGLVELLRRGCREVYCFDASGGEPLAALGDAIALARSELGVEIMFANDELAQLREGEKGFATKRCAHGTLRYTRSTPEVTGKIVYAPTVMTADLPWDLHAFRQRDHKFPHHSTFDQLFTDQKFEAYRVLGYRAAESAMDDMAHRKLPGSDDVRAAVPGEPQAEVSGVAAGRRSRVALYAWRGRLRSAKSWRF